MNKRIICLLIAAALSAALFGCQSQKKEKELPVPERTTIEASENSFGARYTFQLTELCREMYKDVAQYGIKLNKADWEIVSAELADDNGVGYSSLCNRSNGVTFTAAEENDSGKMMNFGCGCLSEKLEDKSYYDSFVGIAAIAAQHTGGYTENDRGFLSDIFIRLLEGDEDILAYEGTLYIKSVDDNTTVLITAPCDASVISENKYPEYTG